MQQLKKVAAVAGMILLGLVGVVSVQSLHASDRPRPAAASKPHRAAPKEPAIGWAAQRQLIRKNEAQRYSYQGTKVVPDAEVQGNASESAELVAELLSRQDYVPGDRAANFAHLRDFNALIIGWSGRILRVDRAKGGVIIEVMMHAVNTSGVEFTNAFILELYSFDGKTLRYLGSKPRIEPPQPLFG